MNCCLVIGTFLTTGIKITEQWHELELKRLSWIWSWIINSFAVHWTERITMDMIMNYKFVCRSLNRAYNDDAKPWKEAFCQNLRQVMLCYYRNHLAPHQFIFYNGVLILQGTILILYYSMSAFGRPQKCRCWKDNLQRISNIEYMKPVIKKAIIIGQGGWGGGGGWNFTSELNEVDVDGFWTIKSTFLKESSPFVMANVFSLANS